MNNDVKIDKLWWLWGPVLVILIQVAIEAFLPQELLSALLSEHGPHEMLQFFCAAAAFFIAASTLFLFSAAQKPWLTVWIILAAAGSLYIAGEELSWGQQVFQWTTPDYWHGINDQGETNLHNTSSWLDQKPRLILEISVVIGGLIIPAILKFRPALLPRRFALIYPPAILGVTAAIMLLVKITDKIDEALPGRNLMERPSEVAELFLFYFLALYLVVLRLRIKQLRSGEDRVISGGA